MIYIHHTTCISPQLTFPEVDLSTINPPVENKFKAIEPSSKEIPASVLRRMGKAVRIGIGAAIPLINKVEKLEGIVIGTANGGMEDCIKFLNQIIQYEEGTLTPTNFVQSTANNIASQTGLFSKNHGYNNTHVHRGMAFENAIIDVAMQVSENPQSNYLLGGVDEISNYNYRISYLDGLYKKEFISIEDLYLSNTPGSIAGEGAAMFIVNGLKENSIAKVAAIKTLHTENLSEVTEQLNLFISQQMSQNDKLDLFISGENGDSRYLDFFNSCEQIANTTTVKYKHLTGEYPTASAFSLWLGCHFIQNQIKSSPFTNNVFSSGPVKNLLIYNNYKGYQHSFIFLTN